MGFSWSTTVPTTKLFTQRDGCCLTRMILPGCSLVLRSRFSVWRGSGKKWARFRTWCSSRGWYATATDGFSTMVGLTNMWEWPSPQHFDCLQMNMLSSESNFGYWFSLLIALPFFQILFGCGFQADRSAAATRQIDLVWFGRLRESSESDMPSDCFPNEHWQHRRR